MFGCLPLITLKTIGAWQMSQYSKLGTSEFWVRSPDQACYVWCKNLAVYIGDCVSLHWMITLMLIFASTVYMHTNLVCICPLMGLNMVYSVSDGHSCDVTMFQWLHSFRWLLSVMYLFRPFLSSRRVSSRNRMARHRSSVIRCRSVATW